MISSKWYWCWIYFLFLAGCSPSSDAPVPHLDQTPYRFFVAGHLYGNQLHADSSDAPYPPFMAHLPGLQEDPLLEMGILLGDLVQSPDESRYAALLSRLGPAGFAHPQFEMHAVPGNHDVEWNGNIPVAGLFEEHWGPGSGKLNHRGSLFLFLNSNQHHWRIQDSQKEMLLRELERSTPDHVFIFVHNLLWWDDNPNTPYHYPTPNSTWNRTPDLNFHSEIMPLLTQVDCPVYVFGGDTGVECNGKELTYHQSDNVHLISTGMGCATHSNYILVKVDAKRNVSLAPIGIGTEDTLDINAWAY